jgi:competence protein ComEA
MKRFSRFAAAAVALSLVGMLFTSPALAQSKPIPTGKINLNSASAQQLTALPGVGPKLAERIVEYRQKSGGFRSTQELLNVQGVGEKGFAKLQPYIIVNGESVKAEGKTDAKADAKAATR